MKYIRSCPSCHSERPVHEMYCQNVIDGSQCGWLLMNVPQTPLGGTVEIEVHQEQYTRYCSNGHVVGLDDFMCMECGADIVEELSNPEEEMDRKIAQYTIVESLKISSATKECFLVKDENEHPYFLTLYHQDCEPDKAIYDVLETSDVDHVAQLIKTGYWEDRFFEVTERIMGGSIGKMEYLDEAQLEKLVDEIGRALRDFSDSGIRHRDLCPNNILIRDKNSFDLVVIDFSSARLSDYDLDVDNPLELTRYTAPEAIIGGVSPASDWWSLGMILLEQITKGHFFHNINDKAFMIHLVTRGVQLPTDIDDRFLSLLKGLLCRDPLKRWNWMQVEKWLHKEFVALPLETTTPVNQQSEKTIQLGDTIHTNPSYFALSAAEEINWEEGLSLFISGELANWVNETMKDKKLTATLRHLRSSEVIDLEWQFSLALMHLNAALPLTWRGQIIIPAWLLSNPTMATQLIEGKIPEYLEDMDREKWLVNLKSRKQYITQKAKNLGVKLDKDTFAINSLSTSRVRLKTEMNLLLQLFPDAINMSLSNLMADIRLSEEDLILIISANRNQFISLENLMKEVAQLAERYHINAKEDFYRTMLVKPRMEIYELLMEHLEGFSKSNNEVLNRWADQFRIEKRLPLIPSILCLSLPKDQWITPPKHEYASSLLRFYEKKIVHASSRGPLVRLIISTHSARIDLTELSTPLKPSEKILENIINRSSNKEDIDPRAFSENELLERRTRRMLLKAANFKRDTGLESLYLGFPFLVSQSKTTHRPRILPILLWPVHLAFKNRGAPSLEIGFDKIHSEIRLNPALSSTLNPETHERIKRIAIEVLGKQSLTIQEVIDAFGAFIQSKHTELKPHASVSYMMKELGLELHGSAVVFNANFTGQAISEDMRMLQKLAHSGTAMEPLLRISAPEISEFNTEVKEKDRYTVVAIDPSQEKAVLQSRLNPGIVIEGPPGTGKSQTIVNIIADCIGRKEKVLVVSQKRAAIQVIMKRLEAVGLDKRMMAITDISSDRQATISSVREQIPNFLKKDEHQSLLNELEIQRNNVTNQIDRIESELDSIAAAVHLVDPLSGMSYRNMLSELIEFQSNDYIDIPEMRRFLEDFSADQLNILEEQLKGLIHYWIPSKFEKSSLVNLKTTQYDEITKAAIQEDLERFYKAEQKRNSCLEQTSNIFDNAQASFYGTWLEEHGQKLQYISGYETKNIQLWFDLLYDEINETSIAEDIYQTLKNLSDNIGKLIASFSIKDFLETLQNTSDEDLEKLLDSCTFCLNASKFKFLNPLFYIHKRRLKNILRPKRLEVNDLNVDALRVALEQEQLFRDYRKQFYQQLQKLGVTIETIIETKVLSVKVEHQLHALEEAIQLVKCIKSCPLKKEGRDLLKTGSVEVYQQFVKDVRDAHERFESRQESKEKIVPLGQWMQLEKTTEILKNIEKNAINTSVLETMVLDMEHYIPFQKFRMRLGGVKAPENLIQCFAILRDYETQILKCSQEEWNTLIQKTIRREGLLGWKQRIERKTPALLMSEREIELNVSSLQKLLNKIQELNRSLLNLNLDIENLGSRSEWNAITRLKGKNYKKLREFIVLGIDIGLMDLRPVWLMSPEVVSQAIPLQSGLFDVVIFDEASQMLIDHAIPSLFRAKRVIISGDEKQMPPMAFFSQKIEADEEIQELTLSEDRSEEELAKHEDAWNRKEVKDCPDLLTLAKNILPIATLEIHYRSQFRSLIDFSNHAFYGGQLHVPAYHPKNEIIRKKPLEVLRVDGIYDEQTNEVEADALINYLSRHWQLPEAERFSTGIVTFNKKQAELIEDKIQERELNDKVFRAILNRERNKVQEGEDMGFFVKNVENVQGDERDMILFSTTFGLNQHGVFRRNFGALGHRGGERRLNVAITRARFKVVIATSMPIKDISDMLSTERPPSKPRDFIQSYLHYSEMHSDGQIEIAKNNAKNLSIQGRYQDIHLKNDGFKNSVKAFIEGLGYDVVENNDYNIFYLDLAIESKGRFVLGIECDTPKNALLKNARYRELWRLQVLEKTIPTIHRITSYQWLNDAETAQNKLKEAIEKSLNKN